MTPHCPTTSSLRIHQVAPVTARYANDYWFHVVHMRAVCYTCYKTEAIYFNARWNKAEAPPSFLLLSMFLCAFSSSIQDFSSSDSTNASACCAEGELYHSSCKESLFHIVSASLFFFSDPWPWTPGNIVIQLWKGKCAFSRAKPGAGTAIFDW